jgi:CelD/BcsL family acetyltransferase involved in cellulose biosynthesis
MATPDTHSSQLSGVSLSLESGDTVNLKFATDISTLESAWRAIEATSNNYAYQTYDWISCWYEHLGHELTISPCPVLIETSAAEPLLILPLGIQQRGPVACLIWLGGELADYHTALFSDKALQYLQPKTFAQLWQRICAELPSFDAIMLEKQPATIDGKPNPFIFTNSTPHSCSAHSTKLAGSLEEFVASKRSSRWRSTERRKERRLADAGVLKFIVASEPEDISRILPAMIRQKSRSYNEMGVPDLFADHGHVGFVSDLTNKLAKQGKVILCALLIGDRISATTWGLVHKNRYYYLLPTYEQDELTRFSPGNLALRHLFGWCLENGIETFDFTAGDEQYKLSWSDQTLVLQDYFVGVTLRGHIYCSCMRVLRTIKRRIKNSPGLFSLAKRIRTLGS